MKGLPYSRFDKEKLKLRDHLAIDRTILANERTVLAYVRTAVTFLIGGIGFIKLFEDDMSMVLTGLAFIIVSLVIFMFGLRNFFKMKKHMRRVR